MNINWSWDTFIWGGWLLWFVVIELAAVLSHRTPWSSLSEFVWSMEGLSNPLHYLFLFGFAILFVHLVARWPS